MVFEKTYIYEEKIRQSIKLFSGNQVDIEDLMFLETKLTLRPGTSTLFVLCFSEVGNSGEMK